MANPSVLSANDRGVLSALFDAEGLPSKTTSRASSLSLALPGFTTAELSDLQSAEAAAIRLLDAPQPTEADLKTAILRLSTIIDRRPEYPSAYNNRAQALMLLLGHDPCNPELAASTCYDDLCAAVDLSLPVQGASPTSLQSKVLAAAYTQRAMLYYEASRTYAKWLKDERNKSSYIPSMLQCASTESLERSAAQDFRRGGEYGNEAARRMAVQLNPYAKMCGEIVKEAMMTDLRESRVEFA